MKQMMKKMEQSFYSITKWATNNQWQSAVIIVLIVLLVFLARFAITPKLQATEIVGADSGYASEVVEELELTSNLGLALDEFLVFDDPDSSLQLFFNPENSNVRIYDQTADVSWNSTFNSTRDFSKLETYEISAMSMLNVTYFGYDNSSAKWNVFKYSVMYGNYKANKIEDGLQLVFDVRNLDSVNLYEFIPQEISKERYESIFMDGIANADILASDRVNLQSTFDFCYRYNAEKNNYYYRLASTPQLSMIDYLIYATELFNYTREDVVSDNKEFGIETVFIERPSFEITMEFHLDNGDFVVTVPTGAIKNGSDKFDITNIEVLPNLGGADYRYTDGFTFVPDGSGAIMELDSYKAAYPRYQKPVYDNNVYFDIYNKNEYSERIEMPVFGMTYKTGLARPIQGFLGIIEQGEEFAYIHSQVSDGYSMNQAYSSFDTIQDTYLKVFGPYAVQTNQFRSASPFAQFSYQVRYKLLGESESTYYEMSQIYREYLIDEYDIESKQSDVRLHLDVLGSLIVSDRLMGIPYDSIHTYTTTGQLATILEEIHASVSVNYMGTINRGVKNDLFNRVEFTKQLEDDLSIEEFLTTYNNIYLGLNLTQSYSDKNGMRDRYAIHDFYGEPLNIEQYNIATGQFEREIITNDYQIVSPRYLPDLIKQYITRSESINNVAIMNMGNTYYVDYNRNNYVNALDAFNVLKNQFELIAEQQSILLPNPFMEFIEYADMITDLSHESSNYGGFSYTVPFKQLVLYGLIPFTTESLNHDTSKVDDYFLLQYTEFAAIPSFMVSYDNTIDLKETEYNYFYSMQYNYHLDDIQYALDYMDDVDDSKTSMTIVDHEIVGLLIYKVTYDDGSYLYLNYNDYTVTVELDDTTSISIESFGYRWE